MRALRQRCDRNDRSIRPRSHLPLTPTLPIVKNDGERERASRRDAKRRLRNVQWSCRRWICENSCASLASRPSRRCSPVGVADPARAAQAREPASIRVNTFPNAKALPVYAGIAKGIFSRYGLSVDLETTQSSQAQRDGLAAGKFHVAHAALDNAVAMVEVAKRDVVIVSGGDSGMNEFFVQSGIASFADLRGKTIVVDAPDTAYALQAKKLLLQHGLREGADYTVKPVGAVAFRYKAMIADRTNAAGILNLPYTVEAAARGLKVLAASWTCSAPIRRLVPSRCGLGHRTMRMC